MRAMALLAAVLVPSAAYADRARTPGDATVFVRIVGSVHAETVDAGIKQTTDLDRVEIGTGSGFVISPFGYVLTNEHVIGNSEQNVATASGAHLHVALKPSRIDVCFQQGVVSAYGLSRQCFEAAVSARDPALDLAVLFVGGTNLPYVALGNSDALDRGATVDALGYPFGRAVEVGKLGSAPDLVPEVSATPGAVSALRADDAGERRYLQITNSVNPGNSGGPLLDREGFAVGVIRMRLARAVGIAFAIPIDAVKDFLEARGLDNVLPAHRLRLGPFQTFEEKHVGLRLPDGSTDISPFRARIETDGRAAGLALRIDRVWSPWNARQIEEALLDTSSFEPLTIASHENRALAAPANASTLAGHAVGLTDGRQDVAMDYAIMGLGPEKIVARYVGSPEQLAFNAQVVRESLASVQAQRAVVGDPGGADAVQWAHSSAPAGQRTLPVPAGWVIESGGPSACSGVPSPGAATTMFAPRDFTVTLRAAAWSAGGIDPEAAASACSSARGSLGRGSYARRGEWLGVSYVVEGVFVAVAPGQLVQLEVSSPDQKGAFARGLLAIWIKKATE